LSPSPSPTAKQNGSQHAFLVVVQAERGEQLVVVGPHQPDGALQPAAGAEAGVLAVGRPDSRQPALGRDGARRDEHAGEIAVEHLQVHAILGHHVGGEDLLEGLEVLIAHQLGRGRPAVGGGIGALVHGNLL